MRVIGCFLTLSLTCLGSVAAGEKTASLDGERDNSPEYQNAEADREGLERIKDDAMLEELTSGGALVPLPENDTLRIDPELESKWHFCRPWTARFLVDLGAAFHAKFGKPLQVNSAVRTIERQKALRRGRHRNRNAGPTSGPKASTHLTGATIDIAKIGEGIEMTIEELRWMREYLLDLEAKGEIEALEERHQAVFHVMVFRTYGASKEILCGM